LPRVLPSHRRSSRLRPPVRLCRSTWPARIPAGDPGA
jgi:hypothetical protein